MLACEVVPAVSVLRIGLRGYSKSGLEMGLGI